jgi:threonine dehydratase
LCTYGIAVKKPGELTFSILDRTLDQLVAVTDEEIAEAIVLCAERVKQVVEGAGAASLADVLAGTVEGHASCGIPRTAIGSSRPWRAGVAVVQRVC